MSSDFATRRRAILEKRLAELHEEYEAAYGQLGRMLADTDTIKIKRQIAYLDEAIKEVEQQLEQSASGDSRHEVNEDNAAATTNTTYLLNLTDILNTRFDLGELRTLAFYLSLDLDDLPGEGKRRKAEELVKYLNRHKRLEELVATGRQRRPDIHWLQILDNSSISQSEELPHNLQASSPSTKTSYRILVDEYHGQVLFNGRLQRELKGKGFEVIRITEPYSREVLFASDIFAIWFPRYFEGKEAHFSNVEVALIKKYLEQGGNALLVGLGWAWTRHGGQSIDTYPLNHIADDYGIFFNDAVISHVSGVSHDEQTIAFHQPFMGHHSITQNVSQISSPKSAPGSLVVSSSATPLIWGSDQLRDSDGARNPIILAAASAGQGKFVCLQHAGYIDSLHDDNFILLVNIFNWLVDKAEDGNR